MELAVWVKVKNCWLWEQAADVCAEHDLGWPEGLNGDIIYGGRT